MDRDQMKDLVLKHKIIAIIRGYDAETCLTLVQALYDGGIRAAEVAFDQTNEETLNNTAQTIARLSEAFGQKMLIGAGTVLTRKQVEMAANAGAAFIVSPDTDPAVIEETRRHEILSIPGALTPTEIKRASDAGGDLIKVFPAGVLGTDYFKALKAPLSHIPLLAVGNIDIKNAGSFMDAGASGLGIGGSLTPKDLIHAGAYDVITARARAFVQAVSSDSSSSR